MLDAADRRALPRQCWCVVPLLAGALGVVTVALVYGMAVGAGHEPPFLPFISATGAEHPESSAFTLGLDVFAVLTLLAMFLQYKRVAAAAHARRCGGARLGAGAMSARALGHALRLNFAALACGFVCVGMLLVLAAFQVFGGGSVVHWIHNVSAIATFVLAVTYLALMTTLLRLVGLARRWHWPRVALVVACALSLVLFVVFRVAFPWGMRLPELGGFTGRTWAALCEYVMVLAFFGFLMSFASDFSDLYVEISATSAGMPLGSGGSAGGRGFGGSDATVALFGGDVAGAPL